MNTLKQLYFQHTIPEGSLWKVDSSWTWDEVCNRLEAIFKGNNIILEDEESGKLYYQGMVQSIMSNEEIAPGQPTYISAEFSYMDSSLKTVYSIKLFMHSNKKPNVLQTRFLIIFPNHYLVPSEIEITI